jgi:biotin carboxylase
MKLNGLSEIFTFFRKNETPIYFVSPTSFNVLGLDRWVGGFSYINHFDSFDGQHPRIFVPKEQEPREFLSMEEICNYLLGHKEVVAHIRSRGPGGKLLTVMFDEEFEQLAAGLGLEVALPSAKLRERLDSKIETTRIGNEAGVASVPNALGRAVSYAELNRLSDEAGLGRDLVVQTPYGDSGRTTFFIAGEADWDKYAENLVDQQLKVMKRINHLPGTVEAVVTRVGTLVGPVMTDLTGFQELTPYRGGWCGNDVFPTLMADGGADKVREMAKKLGARLYEEGYRGAFCLDYLLDTDNGDVYLGELNPRISGATPMANVITSTYGGIPLLAFHLLEFMDVDFDFDLEAVQARWRDFDTWSQLVLKQTEDKVELITKAPMSGIWHMDDDGKVTFVRRSVGWQALGDESEGFYMRVYGAGEYCYKGADLGVIVARGRMQTDDRELYKRARDWAVGISAQFQTTAIPPEAPKLPPFEWSVSKLY